MAEDERSGVSASVSVAAERPIDEEFIRVQKATEQLQHAVEANQQIAAQDRLQEQQDREAEIWLVAAAFRDAWSDIVAKEPGGHPRRSGAYSLQTQGCALGRSGGRRPCPGKVLTVSKRDGERHVLKCGPTQQNLRTWSLRIRKAGRAEGTDEEEKHRARQEAGVFIDIDIERMGLPFAPSYLISAWPQLYSGGAAPLSHWCII